MHSLAIALKTAGHEVSGSDDEIRDPSRTSLARHGLLPEKKGWFPEKLDKTIDTAILGMHAQKDNPELVRAQKLGLNILSLPEYIYEHARNKQRIVIAGSHGKTTITSIIIHVLNYYNRKFDYVVGAPPKGMDQTVRLSDDAPIIVIEGDEYFASALDPTPKFLKYQHHIGLISGISWDHANVFPSEDEYVRQFDMFADQSPKGGILIYCEQDSMALIIGQKERTDVTQVTYKSHPYATGSNGEFYLIDGQERYPVKLFGEHNFQNISGAKEVLRKIGITPKQFYEAMATFEGATGRLERVKETDTATVFRDFAHAPSKVSATVKAVRELHPSRTLVACLELHTYSSLSQKFIPQYRNSLNLAPVAAVYFNPETIERKKLEPLAEDDIKKAFAHPDLKVFRHPEELEKFILQQNWKNADLLMMSSGNFGGLDIVQLAGKILGQN